jgi:hypothetical protein
VIAAGLTLIRCWGQLSDNVPPTSHLDDHESQDGLEQKGMQR